MKFSLITLEIETNFHAGGDLDAFFDDRSSDAGVASDGNFIEKDGFFNFAEGVDANAATEHAFVDATSGDDASAGHEAIGSDAHASAGFVAKNEFGGRVVGTCGTDGPAGIVEVEVRVDGNEVHMRGPVRVDRTDIEPISAFVFGFAGDAIMGEVVDMHFSSGDMHGGDEVTAEVMGGKRISRIEFEFFEQGGGIEDVVSHGNQR